MLSTTGPLERRLRVRGGPQGEAPRTVLVHAIIGAYRQIPGLILHLNQAARLFGLPRQTCAVVMDDLVRDGRLQRSDDGQYLMAHSRENAGANLH